MVKSPKGLRSRGHLQLTLFLPFISAVSGAFTAIYRNIYYLGLKLFRYSKRIIKVLWKIIIKPLKFLSTIVRLIFIAIDHFAFRSFHSFIDELAYFRVKSAVPQKKSRPPLQITTLGLFCNPSIHHNRFFKNIKGCLPLSSIHYFPLLRLLRLYLQSTIGAGQPFALKVTYNNKDIVISRIESVFLEAKSLVEDKLDSIDSSLIDTSEFSASPKYELSLVSLSKLTDSSAISEKLIDAR
jgi:hypothetical protein